MPSFYPSQRPAPPGYQTSDYDALTLHSHYAAYPDSTQQHGGNFGPDPNDLNHVHPNPYDSYKFAQMYAGFAYGHPAGYLNSTNTRSHVAAPIVAPLRVNDYTLHHGNPKNAQRVERTTCPRQSNEDERPVGGVSAKLDYNMDEMTDFVVDMAISIISPNSYNLETYQKWVVQVLNATRLPSATILLSLSYLTLRVRHLSSARCFNPSEYSLYEFLTVALILGSKFLDDNTFQNKSWAEVSNIKVTVLNKEELNWLTSFGHRLHHDPYRLDGFKCWERRWNSYQAKKASTAIATTLQTTDPGLHYQRSLRSQGNAPHYPPPYPVSTMSNIALEPEPIQPTFVAPTYSPYDSWFGQRSTVDRSPSTAPHTGPNTPEFYAGHGGWNPFDPYPARNRTYPFVGPPQLPSNFEAYPPPPYEANSINYNGPNVWNCHGAACQCSSCRQTQVSRYGPVVVG